MSFRVPVWYVARKNGYGYTVWLNKDGSFSSDEYTRLEFSSMQDASAAAQNANRCCCVEAANKEVEG